MIVLPAFAGRLIWRLARGESRTAVNRALRGSAMPARAGFASS